MITASFLKSETINHGSTAIQCPPTPEPGLKISTLGCLLVKRIKSQTLILNLSQIIESSLAYAIFISRKLFSANLASSAVLSSVSRISP